MNGRRRFARLCVCRGTGLVEVLNDARFVGHSGEPLQTDTVTVACKCECGEAMQKGREVHDPLGNVLLPTFDETMRLLSQVRWKCTCGYVSALRGGACRECGSQLAVVDRQEPAACGGTPDPVQRLKTVRAR